ncbi:MAG TPA: hypothetical protein VNS49_07105 [Streptomyces sp.]|nr:hypothetical protein [Streptomyces sp.]
MDTPSSDVARLLRSVAVRASACTLLVAITGETLLTVLVAVFALSGLGLLLLPGDSTDGPPAGPD